MKNITSELKTALDVALLKKSAMHGVAGDKGKTKMALGILIAGVVLGMLGMRFFLSSFVTISILSTLGNALYQLIMLIIGIYVLSVIAKSIFKGAAKHDEFFRVFAYGMIVMWLSIIPALAIVYAIWGLVIVFVVLKVVHKLTTGGAIGTIIVSILAMFVISLILSPILGVIGIGGVKGKFELKGMGKYMEDVMEREGAGDVDIEMEDEDEFEMKIDGGEGGTMRMEDGKITITGPEGEVMQFSTGQ